MKKLVVAVILVLLLTACGPGGKSGEIQTTGRCNAFQATFIDLPGHANMSLSVRSVISIKDYLIFLQYMVSYENNQYLTSYQLVWTDLTGKIVQAQAFDMFSPSFLVAGADRVYVVGEDEEFDQMAQAYTVDGSIGERIDFDTQFRIGDARLFDNTWVLSYDDGPIDFVRDGQTVFSVPGSAGDMGYHELRVEGGEIVLKSWDESLNPCWRLIDPITLSDRSIPNTTRPMENINVGDRGMECSAPDGYYTEDLLGIYRLDLETGEEIRYMSLSDSDIPPSRYGVNPISLPIYIADDNHYLYINHSNEVQNLPPEVILMTRCDQDPHAEKKTITLGGYHVSFDYLMQYAVYEFNTKTPDYRIRFREYAEEYPIASMEDFTRMLASLLGDMSKNKDDILYGSKMFMLGNYTIYDFPQMGRNGLLLDMMPYLEADPDIGPEDWIPGIFNLMKTDDALYRFFPGFNVKGFFSNTYFFDGAEDISVEKLTELSRTLSDDKKVYPRASSQDMIVSAIIYDIDHYLDENGVFRVTEGQMQALLDYALECGQLDETNSQQPLIHFLVGGENEDYLRRKYAMYPVQGVSPTSFYEIEKLSRDDSFYAGIPTLGGAAQICEPSAPIAISDGTKYPDACWEFVKILMSPEIQQIAAEKFGLPVSQDEFEVSIKKATHPELLPAIENYQYRSEMLLPGDPVPEEIAERFSRMIDSLTVIEENDYELMQIIIEECMPALTGQKTSAETADILSNRINIYLQS